jgi:hypothetical protein
MSRAFTRRKLAWLAQVNADRTIPHTAVRVALALVPYFNERRTGRAWPSLETLQSDTGLGFASVHRGIRALEQRGHLLVVWGKRGRGHANHYWMATTKHPLAEVLAIKKPPLADVIPSKKKDTDTSSFLTAARAREVDRIALATGIPREEVERALADVPSKSQ